MVKTFQIIFARFIPNQAVVLFLLLLLGISMPGFAADRNKKVQLPAKIMTIKEIFAQVEKQTGLVTVYSNDELDMSQTVNLNSSSYSLDDLYQLVLRDKELRYEISEKYIVIKTKKRSSGLGDGTVAAGQRKIRGIVADDQGLPLQGATVLVKGTSNGVVADQDGNYELLVPVKGSAVIEASFVGMISKQINLKPNQSDVDFLLLPNENTMDAVMIVGAYGTKQKRSDLVSSVFQVNEKQLKTLPAARIDNILDGLVPGLQVSYNTDAASSTKMRYNLRIRGEGSLAASSEPLWVVDGVPMYTGDKTNLVSGINTAVSPLSYLNYVPKKQERTKRCNHLINW
ncbi:MAG: hypothetical protein BGN96_15090 [Bacteroidales bacterium 45-6]|nr:MAG: hypothetical protein BGN96_15090 [Bacteroidales bacterium 45-6]